MLECCTHWLHNNDILDIVKRDRFHYLPKHFFVDYSGKFQEIGRQIRLKKLALSCLLATT